MSSVSTSSPSSTPRHGLLSKMFQKPVSTQTHPYPNPSTSARDSERTLVSPPGQCSPKKGGNPDAVFGTLSSTYGWGGALVPALPSTGQSRKTPKVKPTAAKQGAAVPASSTPHQPIQSPLTQAQREQATVDLSSRYGHASSLPGGRWGM